MLSAPPPAKLSVRLLAASAVLVVFGVASVALGQMPVGAVLATIGLILGIGTVIRRRPGHVDEQALAASAAAQAAVSAARDRVAAAQHRRDWAVSRCAALGLPAEPAAVRAVVVARSRIEAHAGEVRRWTEQRDALVGELSAAGGELAGALGARTHPAASADIASLGAAAEAYRTAGQLRAEQAAAASRLPDLIEQRDAVLAAERRTNDDYQAREAAAQNLIAVAARCGVRVETPVQGETALTKWENERAERLAQLADNQRDWARLQALLDGRTLDELRELAKAAMAKATDLVALLSPGREGSVDASTAADKLPGLRQEAAEANNLAAAAGGELRQFAASVPSVSEAEETLEQTELELASVRELQQTLELTTAFLTAAQDRVHPRHRAAAR